MRMSIPIWSSLLMKYERTKNKYNLFFNDINIIIYIFDKF